MCAQGHEVLIFRVIDPYEEEFPFNRWVEFLDLETGISNRLDAVPLKKIYREEFHALTEEWKSWAKKFNVHLVDFHVNEPTETLLSEYVSYRLLQQS